MALRRSAIEQSGILASGVLSGRAGKSLTSGEDYEIGVRLRRAGFEAWYEPSAVCGHLIPPERMHPEYILRLTRGVSQSEPWISWMAAGEPSESWVLEKLSTARRKLGRTRWLEWRPWRRPVRMAQRQGRCDGWEQVLQHVRQRVNARTSA